MAHLPLFRVRSWNNGMCCMPRYFILVILAELPRQIMNDFYSKHLFNQPNPKNDRIKINCI